MKNRLAWIVWRAAAAPIVFIALFGFSLLVLGLNPDYPGGFRMVEWAGHAGIAALTLTGLVIGLVFLVAAVSTAFSAMASARSPFARSAWFVGIGALILVAWSGLSTYGSWQEWSDAPRQLDDGDWALDFTTMSAVAVGGVIGLVYFVAVDWFADRLDRFAARLVNKDST